MNTRSIDPVEWDFRAVTAVELPYATDYEYHREDTAFRSAAVHWLDSKVKGKKVRSILAGEDQIDAGDLDCPLSFAGKLFAESFPLFPAPWLAFDEDQRRECARDLARFARRPTVSLIPLSEVRYQKHLADAGNGIYLLRMDLTRFKAKDILACFEAKLRAEAKKHRRLSGKASAEPWQRLKWLAARRLAAVGWKHPGVNEFISQHRARVAVKNPADVLPVYSQSGAWYGALAGANKALLESTTV